MKIAVIGSGITGLSTAYYLTSRCNATVDIYERDNDFGGLAGSFNMGNMQVDKCYHFIYTHDKHYMELLEELALTEYLTWEKSSMGYFYNGVTHPFTTPMDILRFKPLSFINRMRFGLSSIYISLYKNIEKLETINNEQFLKKVAGKQPWDIIYKPMLKVKFGDNYKNIPAVWLWERIASRLKSRKGAGKDEIFGYIEGSFQRVHKKIIESIKEKGGELHLNNTITEILIENEVCKGFIANGKKKTYDYVFCTTPLPIFIDLCKNAPKDYVNPLKKVKYDGVVILIMILKKKLSDVYWLNISDDKIPFGGIIEHTNLFSDDSYGGKHIVYLSKYTDTDDKLFHMDEDKIRDYFLEHLSKVNKDFNENMVEDWIVFRNKYGQPIWPMQYSKFKPKFRTPVDKLYMVNTSQIYPMDRAMNYIVELSKKAIEEFRQNELDS
ncbi:MAG: NAD(P)/FAD-dependent oxidoreductase [Clostridium sp.]|nr:NAD(P)/FAD-dependent oxidoreductase [Clostridium sp.]